MGSVGYIGSLKTIIDSKLTTPPGGSAGQVLAKTATSFGWVTPASGTGGAAPGVTYVDAAPYNAKGDGSTDDLAAIKAAVAALPNGGTLVFTPGKTYLTSNTFEISGKVGVSVIMTGATITTTGTNDNSAVVRMLNCSGGHVTGGYLLHKNASTRKNACDGLTLEHCSNILVQAVNVGYTYSMGIRAAGSSRITILGCSVVGTMADGIGAYPGERYSITGDGAMASGSAVLSSPTSYFQGHDVGSKITVYGAGTGGSDLVTTIVSRQSGAQVTLATAASTATTSAFVRIQRPSSAISFIGNHVVGTGDDGISSVSYLYAGGPNRDIVVTGNTVEGSLARGILLCGTKTSTVGDNTVRDSAMAGIYCVTEIAGGNNASWGVTDTSIVSNTIEGANTNYPTDNYPAIGAGSASDDYPILGLHIADNIIRGAFSYYIEVGAYGPSNTSVSCRDITISDNDCYGGNGDRAGIYLIRARDIRVSANRVSRARTAAIAIDGSCGGHVIVRDNVTSNHDRIGQGFSALDIPSSLGAIVYNNVVNGVLIASGTTGGGANPGGTAA